MSRLLVIKTGSTVKSLLAGGEDFEHWFAKGCGLAPDQYEVVPVFQGASLPEIDRFQGVIVTGSPAFVTDRERWSEDSAEFLRQAVAAQLPVLGVCYGHQLLAHALGGVVDFHDRGREIGTVNIRLNAQGRMDPLLGILPPCFDAQVSHSQTVVALPAGACLLAANEFEPHHAFRVGENAWGVQFHPEFSERIVKAYIEARREDLLRENLDPQKLLQEVKSTVQAAGLLRRFVQLMSARMNNSDSRKGSDVKGLT